MGKTHYIWDYANDSYLMEKDETGATTAVYTNEPIPHGKLISQRRGGQTYFHHYDGHGSTRTVTDQSQNIVETATYSAFGQTVAKTSTITNPFGFKGALGYYANPETEDVYVRARVYRPKLGRWLQPDPLGIEFDLNTNFAGVAHWLTKKLATANLYSYVSNNPISKVDPSGLGWLFPTVQECVDQLKDCLRNAENAYWDCMSDTDSSAYLCWALKSVMVQLCASKLNTCLARCPQMWCGVVLIGAGAIVCCVDTPVPGPCDIPGCALAGAGCAMIGIGIPAGPDSKQ